jgi:beta-glucosidase
MYVRYPTSAVERPAKQLVGFKRVALAAGQTKTVTMELKAEQIAYWDSSEKRFVVEGVARKPAGRSTSNQTTSGAERAKIEILIGSSSENIRLTRTVP